MTQNSKFFRRYTLLLQDTQSAKIIYVVVKCFTHQMFQNTKPKSDKKRISKLSNSENTWLPRIPELYHTKHVYVHTAWTILHGSKPTTDRLIQEVNNFRTAVRDCKSEWKKAILEYYILRKDFLFITKIHFIRYLHKCSFITFIIEEALLFLQKNEKKKYFFLQKRNNWKLTKKAIEYIEN